VLTLEHGAPQLPVPATDRQRGVPNSNAQ
jgi:hypothetical protein